MVLVAGLEPAWIGIPRILSPLRLPIPPHEQYIKTLRQCIMSFANCQEKYCKSQFLSVLERS